MVGVGDGFGRNGGYWRGRYGGQEGRVDCERHGNGGFGGGSTAARRPSTAGLVGGGGGRIAVFDEGVVAGNER